MSWVEGTVDADGVEIHYVRTGDSSKPAVVLLHGFTDNARCWTRVAQTLEQAFDVVMVDSRNHGDSGTAAGSCTEMADDVAGVIDQLEIGPVMVGGHSLGAATAAELGARHPELVSRLVLEDPPWRRPTDAAGSSSGDARRRGLQAFIDSFAGMSFDDIVSMGRAQHDAWHDIDFTAWATAKQQVRPEAIESITLLSWAETVAQLRCPTLVIHGEVGLGGVIGTEVAAEIAALNPLVSTAVIEGAGHNVRRERFEPYVQHLQAFLRDR